MGGGVGMVMSSRSWKSIIKVPESSRSLESAFRTGYRFYDNRLSVLQPLLYTYQDD